MPSLIYVITSKNGPLKIGISVDPMARLMGLQIGSPVVLELAFVGSCGAFARAIELRVHRGLRDSRAHGEWHQIQVPDAIREIRHVARGLGASVRDVTQAHRVRMANQLALIPHVKIANLDAAYDTARLAAAEFIAASKSTATHRAYASDWQDFEAWCAANGLASMPSSSETVAVYLSALVARKLKVSTIKRRTASIAHFHLTSEHANPCLHAGVRATLSGISRSVGSARKKKAALTSAMLAKAIRKIPTDTIGLRDRALLLMGFVAALRRSELVAINLGDIARHPKGIVLTLRRSKTDQAGEGMTKAIPHGTRLCAVAALDAWLQAARIDDGPVFRGVRGKRVLEGRLVDRQVARVVKSRCAAIGLDPNLFAGHSLRSGFITSAAESGADLSAIAKHAGHAKLDTTLGYVQIADAFRDHSGKRFL